MKVNPLVLVISLFLIDYVATDSSSTQNFQCQFLEDAYHNLSQQATDCEGKFICELTSVHEGLFRHEVTCINRSQVCDGTNDCPLANDEMHCPPSCGTRVSCSDRDNCATPCNNNIECDGEEDETQCPNSCTCGPGMYRCLDGQRCIKKAKICDGNMDCTGGDDETPCPTDCPCTDGQFRCNTGTDCVSPDVLCDGTNDCPDGSDESSCRQGCFCDPNQLVCLDGGMCVDRAEVCNIDSNECCNDNAAICMGENNEDDNPGCIIPVAGGG